MQPGSGTFRALTGAAIAYGLIEGGDLSHPSLDATAERIRALNAKTATGDGAAAEAHTGASSEPPESSQPPAMPT